MGATGARRAAVRQLTAPCSSLRLAAQAHAHKQAHASRTQTHRHTPHYLARTRERTRRRTQHRRIIDTETHCTAGLSGTGYINRARVSKNRARYRLGRARDVVVGVVLSFYSLRAVPLRYHPLSLLLLISIRRYFRCSSGLGLLPAVLPSSLPFYFAN